MVGAGHFPGLWSFAFTLFANAVSAQSPSAASSSPSSSKPPIWPVQTFVTEPTFKPPVFKWNKTGDVEPGLILFSPTVAYGEGETAVVITTDEGEMIWQSDPSLDASNLTPGRLDGKPVLHYWAGKLATSIGRGYGYCIILDDTYTPIYNVTLHDDIVVSDPDATVEEAASFTTFIDQHEQYLTERGTLIVTAYNATPYDLTPVGGPADGWLLDGLVYEIDIKTNKVLFKWRASDHPDTIPLNGTYLPYGAPTAGLGNNITAAFDYFHHNAIQDFEDGYIISSRHFWTSFYISKTTGEVIWQIDGGNGGDFELGPGANFSWQHDIRVRRREDKKIVMHMHDNANDAPFGTNDTLGLFLIVDDQAKTVTKKAAVFDQKHPVATFAEGSCQPLNNGHVLMEYGIVPQAKEFNAAHELVWEAQYGFTEQTSSYRMYRHKWSGTPKTRPKVSACLGDGKTKVYMSWNGATDFDEWVIYTGQGQGHSGSSTRVKKDGFETFASISATEYVTVEAVNCEDWWNWNAYRRHWTNANLSKTVKVNATCSS